MADAHPGIGGLRYCLGGNVFGWTSDADQSFAVLDAFYEAGGRMVDTADVYMRWHPGNKGGESETIIGAWMEARGVRGDMLIATKCGLGDPPDGLRPDKVAAAMEGSLERLRTDYVDLFYAHGDDGVTPLEDVVEGFHTLVAAGKARELGASNYSAERLAAVTATADRLGKTPFTVLQPKYNLQSRSEYEGALQALCIERGIAVLPYYGLASGFLTGKYRKPADWEGKTRAKAVESVAENGGWAVLAVMDGVARETGATLSQIALAWVNAQPGIAAPLASATRVEQLVELVGGASLQLDAGQIARLDAALSV